MVKAVVVSLVVFRALVAVDRTEPNGYVGYDSSSGAVVAGITVGLAAPDEACDCDPVTLVLLAGCEEPLEILVYTSNALRDPVTGNVTGAFGPYPGLDPGICNASVTVVALCGGENPCPLQSECVSVTCNP